ncbi:MAG: hypothetical protein IH586_03025 [Anaerolineaceae bacterium]|nr:hypothetical protein [Anaerolineaceae bacterium]
MNRLQNTNPRRLIIFAVLLMILSGILFFWMRDLVREMVVYPVSYLIFVIGIFIDSTPQIFFWFAGLLLSFWIAYRSLNRKRKIEDIPNVRPVRDQGLVSKGRMTFWAVKVNILEQYRGGYFMGGLHHSLARLLMDLLAHRYRLTVPQVEERVRSGELALPEDVQEYLRYSITRQDIGTGRIRRLWEVILAVIRDRLKWKFLQEKDEGPAAQAMRRIDKVILYMEEELEVSHEQPSQSSR